MQQARYQSAVTATLLGKVKFLANAKTELPLDKPISNDGFVL